jgi:hypothetical protein
MAKRRHEEEQEVSSKTTMAVMTIGGLAVAALVVWALTRTVQPAPSVLSSTDVPVTAIEQPAGTPPPAVGAFPPTTTAGSTAAPARQTPPPGADETAKVARISPSELRPKVDAKQVTVIDVRDKTTYMGSHIPGSLHIPFAQVESQVTFLPKDKPIVTYCT